MKRRVDAACVKREPGQVKAGDRKSIEDGLGVSTGEENSKPIPLASDKTESLNNLMKALFVRMMRTKVVTRNLRP